VGKNISSLTPPDSNISDAVTASGENISDALLQIQTTLNSLIENSSGINSSQVIFAMFIAFIGALSAYLFNFFHWKMVEKKGKISKIAIGLSDLIHDLEEVSVSYWVCDYKEEKQQEIHVAEISIKSKRHLISKYIRIISTELNTIKTASVKQHLEEFNLDIFDLVTGDGFESKTRVASKQKAMEIAKRCSDVKAMISSLEFHR